MTNTDFTSLSLDQIRALLDAAWECRRSDPQECVRAARQVLEQPLENAELARAAFCLGFGLMRLGEYREAEPEFRRAHQLYGDLNDQEGQHLSLNLLGVMQTRQGRPAEGLASLLQARALGAGLGDIQGEIDALINVGAAYDMLGNHSSALETHLLILRLSQRNGMRHNERIALNNLSVLYVGVRRYEDALEVATACLKMRAESENPDLDAAALQNAGEAHFGLEQFPQARVMFEQAREITGRLGNSTDLAVLDLSLGRVARRQGVLQEAQQLFSRSLEIFERNGDGLEQVECLLELGQILGESGQLGEALDALHRARTVAEDGQLRDELSTIDLALSRLYRQAGRAGEALTHLEQHLQLREEVFSAESDQRFQSLRVEFGLEQAERERLAAQRQNAELSELNAQVEATNRDLRAAQTRTAELLARLEQHANEDALTGLPNRRAFDAALERVSPSQQISAVLCDIDHFKIVNDRFSHLVGDDVLRQVAALLRGQLHRGDLLARYGGEEFVLLLTGASQVATLELCENLRRVTENHDWSTLRPGLSLTISVGAAVAQLNPATLSVRDVVQSADDALYAAKNAGRNRVEVRQIAPGEG